MDQGLILERVDTEFTLQLMQLHVSTQSEYYCLFGDSFCRFSLGPLNFFRISLHAREDNARSYRFPSRNHIFKASSERHRNLKLTCALVEHHN
jgi:hypothetical protein